MFREKVISFTRVARLIEGTLLVARLPHVAMRPADRTAEQGAETQRMVTPVIWPSGFSQA